MKRASTIKRREWIIFLYDKLSECKTEEEAHEMIALIDHEESFLPGAAPVGKLLGDLTLKPYDQGDE